MEKLSREDLYSLEDYSKIRNDFRSKVMAHKKDRQLQIGPNATLYFEDRMTMQYQIQEMLRIERIFETEGIMDELNAYNPLIPDGSNWKATFMIEFPDPIERAQRLATMIGIELKTWMQVDGFDKIWPIADEDLERESAEKTSSVHFMRWELTAEMAQAVKDGANIKAGIDHDAYNYTVDVPANMRDSLAEDLD
jgi:hypothetical protein